MTNELLLAAMSRILIQVESKRPDPFLYPPGLPPINTLDPYVVFNELRKLLDPSMGDVAFATWAEKTWGDFDAAYGVVRVFEPDYPEKIYDPAAWVEVGNRGVRVRREGKTGQ